LFHESLVFYNQQSAERMNQMLAEQFALSTGEVANLMSAGQSYVTAIQRIDEDARTEARRRYLDVLGPAAGSAGPPVSKTKPSTEPPKSVRERAIGDGLYAQVEAKKQAALNSHITGLTRSLGAPKMDQIGKFVQSSVAPRIQTFVQPPNTKASPGLPPGLNRETPARAR
jgi:hypothetical protein